MTARSGLGRYQQYQKYLQRVGFALLWGTAGITVGILAVVIGYIFVRGFPALSLDLLTTPPAGGLSGEGGISTTILTTVYLVALTVVIAGPLGVGAAIYMSEYARENAVTNAIRFGVEMLGGVPSIVFGLFGYALFVAYLRFGFSLLSASLATGALILPLVIRTAEEALRAVPVDQREASLALGTTKWQTITGVVLPAALPGILTGIILSVGRIVSETAVLYVTLGGTHLPPRNVMDGGRTLALHLFYLASETNATQSKVMATGVVLVALVLIINITTNLLLTRWKSKAS
ncbi:MAG: phosphate ABC transporter permease PstA [Anaerolineae bacterium]